MDTVIVAVFAICEDILRAMRHKDDIRSQMSDAEVMTTAVVAMLYFSGNFERSRIFLKEMGYIPRMLSKSRFNRRLHQIKPMFLNVFCILAETWKAWNKNSIYSIDTFPVPVCDNYRIRRCQIYQGDEYRGYVSSKKQYYYGIKLHLMVTELGQPVEFFLTPASLADVSGLQFFDFDLPAGAKMYADRGYNHYVIEDVLKEAGIIFQPMRKKNSKRPFPPWICYLQHAYRKMVETTGSLLNQLFPKRIHAVTAQGFELKMVLFVLALSFQFFK